MQIGFQLAGRRRPVQNIGGDVDAVTGLLHVKANFVRSLAGEDVYFAVFPGLHFDAAIGDIVDYNDRAGVDGEVLFEMLARCYGGPAPPKPTHGPHQPPPTPPPPPPPHSPHTL